jgi:hypothetical protein
MWRSLLRNRKRSWGGWLIYLLFSSFDYNRDTHRPRVPEIQTQLGSIGTMDGSILIAFSMIVSPLLPSDPEKLANEQLMTCAYFSMTYGVVLDFDCKDDPLLFDKIALVRFLNESDNKAREVGIAFFLGIPPARETIRTGCRLQADRVKEQEIARRVSRDRTRRSGARSSRKESCGRRNCRLCVVGARTRPQESL